MKPELSSLADTFDMLRDAASAAARNLGLGAEAQQISPEHWQRVLAAVEVRMGMRGIALPKDWREDLADQMGRTGADAAAEPES
ncbi:hypothetical protein MKK88_09570 [Methylobacterium sp. E-005]|uniref:hypothetical protein n=1 Tax=Methylobacterium sp. E-005 TaxID=2836549 RepID=UPI001FB96748|nr:hypothetical protein [Methylobacterium sp. E-005]MCJ2086242.1 hypothetical protein [Methylobacterium sp. E-005]